MAQLSWSLTALDSLRAVVDYIERDSPLYAATLVQRVFDASRARHIPRMGRVVPSTTTKPLRRTHLQGYRIVYKIDSDVVRIVLVIHSVRDLQQQLPEEPWSLR